MTRRLLAARNYNFQKRFQPIHNLRNNMIFNQVNSQREKKITSLVFRRRKTLELCPAQGGGRRKMLQR